MEKSQSPEDTKTESVNQDKTEKRPSYESYRELLGEKKELQQKYRELKAWREEVDLKEKEQQGKHKEVIDSLRSENKKLKDDLLMKTKSFAYSKFEEQIKYEAAKNNCVNPDKLMKLLTKDQIKSVQVDDTFKVNKDDLTRLMNDLKDEHKDIGLFKNTNVNVNNVTGDFKAEKQDLTKMSKDDIISRLRSLE